ncbi:MAG: dephospho-CoA kinase [Geminicoccaceae bacterium]
MAGPLVIGLTGGIAMGKSRVARLLAGFGVPVFDADAAVHALLRPGSPVVPAVEAAFPGVGDGAGGIDRRALGGRVFGDVPALRRLEAILHPAVRAAERRFLGRMARQRFAMAALDIPLLLETGAERLCDCVVVVDAGPRLQAARALARPGMTPRGWRRSGRSRCRGRRSRSGRTSSCARAMTGASAAAVAAMLDRLEAWPRRAWPARWQGAA